MEKSKGELRREKRIKMKKNELINIAMNKFAENGFRNTSMSEIADSAEMASGTIYNYFKNKEELLMEIIKKYADRSLGEIDNNSVEKLIFSYFNNIYNRNEETNENEFNAILAFLPEILMNKKLGKEFFINVINPRMNEARKYILELREQDKINEIDPELITRTVFSSFIGMTVLYMMGDKFLDEEKIFSRDTLNEMVKIYSKGLEKK